MSNQRRCSEIMQRRCAQQPGIHHGSLLLPSSFPEAFSRRASVAKSLDPHQRLIFYNQLNVYDIFIIISFEFIFLHLCSMCYSSFPFRPHLSFPSLFCSVSYITSLQEPLHAVNPNKKNLLEKNKKTHIIF